LCTQVKRKKKTWAKRTTKGRLLYGISEQNSTKLNGVKNTFAASESEKKKTAKKRVNPDTKKGGCYTAPNVKKQKQKRLTWGCDSL